MFLYVLLTASLLGCTSVKSTALNRTESDVFIGNSNGKPRAHCAARPFNGVPITLRVPTHLDVVIKEKIYLKVGAERGSLSRLKSDKRSLFVETQIIETDKVFTVDPKRPAAGQLDYTMKFGSDESGIDGGEDNSQYFASINSRIQDDTIKDITGALKAVTDSLAAKTNVGESKEPDLLLIPDVRTVAWRRFDIDACDFEQQVADFVAIHMSSCNSCQAYNAMNTVEFPAGELPPEYSSEVIVEPMREIGPGIPTPFD
jgi:hypothetical protein